MVAPGNISLAGPQTPKKDNGKVQGIQAIGGFQQILWWALDFLETKRQKNITTFRGHYTTNPNNALL